MDILIWTPSYIGIGVIVLAESDTNSYRWKIQETHRLWPAGPELNIIQNNLQIKINIWINPNRNHQNSTVEMVATTYRGIVSQNKINLMGKIMTGSYFLPYVFFILFTTNLFFFSGVNHIKGILLADIMFLMLNNL